MADSQLEAPARETANNSRRVAWLLDECIRIPGTNIRFGLDPILGLIPGGGETVVTLIGAVILGNAGKRGVPYRTLLKMGGNMIFNAALGAIPGVGDLFSFWFKSNSRNYKLLEAYQESSDGEEPRGGWWPVLFIVGVVSIVIVINLVVWVFVYSALFRFCGDLFGK